MGRPEIKWPRNQRDPSPYPIQETAQPDPWPMWEDDNQRTREKLRSFRIPVEEPETGSAGDGLAGMLVPHHPR